MKLEKERKKQKLMASMNNTVQNTHTHKFEQTQPILGLNSNKKLFYEQDYKLKTPSRQ